MISIIGRDNRYSPPRDSMALFRFDDTTKIWDQWYAEDGEEGTQFRGIAYCPASKLVVAVEPTGHVTAMNAKPIHVKGDSASLSRGDRHRTFSPLTVGDVEGDTVAASDQDAVTGFEMLSCEEKTITGLITTTRGTTTQLTVSRDDSSDKIRVKCSLDCGRGLGSGIGCSLVGCDASCFGSRCGYGRGGSRSSPSFVIPSAPSIASR